MICYAANCPKELQCMYKEANGTSFLGFQDTSYDRSPNMRHIQEDGYLWLSQELHFKDKGF